VAKQEIKTKIGYIVDEDKVKLKSFRNPMVATTTRSFTGTNYFVKPTFINTTRSFDEEVSVNEGKAVKYTNNWVSVREV